jgi:hypothetical protein
LSAALTVAHREADLDREPALGTWAGLDSCAVAMDSPVVGAGRVLSIGTARPVGGPPSVSATMAVL